MSESSFVCVCVEEYTRRRQHFLAIIAWLLVCTDSSIGTHPLDANDLANESIFCPVSTVFGNWLLYSRLTMRSNVGIVWKKKLNFKKRKKKKRKKNRERRYSVSLRNSLCVWKLHWITPKIANDCSVIMNRRCEKLYKNCVRYWLLKSKVK